jgi:hypothetical protein
MSSGLTYTGAIARGLAYPPALPRETAPTAAPALALDPVMPQAAPDGVSLFRMGALERIRTEAGLMADAALRDMKAVNQTRAHVRAEANFVDLRV